MGGERCETCRHWYSDENDNIPPRDEKFSIGECRRRSPVLILAMAPAALADYTVGPGGEREDDGRHDVTRVFPHTYCGDWCGEWAAKPEGGGA
jgi:hypothetical protein